MCQPRLPWIHSAGHRPTIFLYILIFLPQATGIQGSFCSCGQGKVGTAVPPVLTGSAARAAFLPAGLNSWTTTEPQESLLVGLGLMSHSPSREGFADGVVSLYPISWAGVRGPCTHKSIRDWSSCQCTWRTGSPLELGCQLRTALAQPAVYRRRGSISQGRAGLSRTPERQNQAEKVES